MSAHRLLLGRAYNCGQSHAVAALHSVVLMRSEQPASFWLLYS